VVTLANPLQAASYAGYGEIVQLLIDNGANVNIIDSHGRDSWTDALAGGHTKVADLLLDCNKLSAITTLPAILSPLALVNAVKSSKIEICENQCMGIAGWSLNHSTLICC
jgi:ankyrin repeat protein